MFKVEDVKNCHSKREDALEYVDINVVVEEIAVIRFCINCLRVS